MKQAIEPDRHKPSQHASAVADPVRPERVVLPALQRERPGLQRPSHLAAGAFDHRVSTGRPLTILFSIDFDSFFEAGPIPTPACPLPGS